MEATSERYLEGRGESRLLGSDRPFLLEGSGAWLVQSGHVDVFATSLDQDGALAGRRRHLFRLGAGELALGIDQVDGDRSFGLLGVGTNGAEVIVLARSELDQLLNKAPAEPDIAAWLDGWIGQVNRSMVPGPFPDDCEEVEAGALEAAEETLCVRPKDETLWVRQERGHSLFVGSADLVSNGTAATPLAPSAWLELSPGSSIRAESTAQAIARREIWNGLDQLHGFLLETIRRAARERSRDDRARLRRRIAGDQRVFVSACANIAETLDGDSLQRDGSVAGRGQPESAIFQACKRVGESLGIHVAAPPRALEGSMSEPIALIARASRFRIRQVLLRDDWWRVDGGSFVAFTQEEGAAEEDQGSPVALLRSRSGYVLHDPVARTQQKVTAQVAERIAPHAYTLYRPMPEKKMGALDLIRFGLEGALRDRSRVLILSIIIGLIGLVPPLAIRTIFNDVIPSADRSALMQLALGLMIAAAATGFLDLARSRSIVRIEGHMGTTLQSAVWDRLLALPMPFFRPYTAGELAHRTLAIETIRRTVSGPVLTSLLAGVFSLLHVGLLFYYSRRLAWWATLVIGITIAMICLVAWAQMGAERTVAKIRARLSGTLLQFLSSIGKLRVAGAEVHAFALWAKSFSQQRRVQLRSRTWLNVLRTYNAGIPLLGNLVIYAVAARMMLESGSLRTGDFLAFAASFSLGLTGILQASNGLIGMMKIIPAYEQAVPILEAMPEVDSSKAEPGRIQGEIEVRHLTFRYQADGPLILRDVGLQVRPGEFVALVGPSGSGKSTLLRLLLGFESPDSGAIYYDGQELAGLDLQAVRAQIGTVLQNGRLTSGDIFSNIVGSSRATLDLAWAAARMAGLDQDIESLPMGMHTVLSEGAGTLSGGQRQRLLIARALVNKPKIVFFDEATSALDNRTQAIVTESLDAIQATRIVVAHRLSTIQRADTIYVLDHGKVIESGPFDQLLAQNGVFAELAKRQLT